MSALVQLGSQKGDFSGEKMAKVGSCPRTNNELT